MVGRGVLLDYASWAKEKGIEYSAASKHLISEKDLDQIAAAQGTTMLPGDILLVRTGWIQWYNEASPEERTQGCKIHHNYCGVEGTAAVSYTHLTLPTKRIV